MKRPRLPRSLRMHHCPVPERDLGPRRQLELWATRALLVAGSLKILRSERGDHAGVLGLAGLDPASCAKAPPTRQLLERKLRSLATSTADRGPLFANIDLLGDALGLDAAARELLAFVVSLDVHGPLGDCLNLVGVSSARRLYTVLAAILGLGVEEVRQALRPDAVLRASGLVLESFGERLERELPLHPMERLDDLLLREHASPAALLSQFFRRTQAGRLQLADFQHLKPALQVAGPLLATALRSREPGVNVLLWGPPGTGKTELCRALAVELGVPLYEVNDQDLDGEAITGSARFAAYRLSQRLLARGEPALILFDEIEDVFPAPSDGREPQAKAFVNRTLEENAVPALWVTNSIGRLDRAYLRRFDLVLELKIPPTAVRRRILEATLTGLPARPAWIERASRDERLSPAALSRAARVGRLVAPADSARAEQLLDCVLAGSLGPFGRAGDGGPGPEPLLRWDPRLLNADCDLERLLDGLARNPRGNLCLYGPPGTGKTELARAIALRVERPLLVQRASELLGKYVGETEERIAAAFRRAGEDGAVLLLDEVDGLLRSRERALHAWEVTSVSELLVQLEAFEGLAICATNLVEELDPAALRRFAVKIRFSPSRPEQRLALFAAAVAALGGTVPEESDTRQRLDALTGLTPGDFATVVRRARLLGEGGDVEALLAALAREQELKPGAAARVLGFGVG